MEKRPRVCLDCRSVVASDNRCPGGPKHRVVNLASNGRSKLVDEVWGPPSWRRERRRLARAGGGGAAAGGVGDIASGCGGCDFPSVGGDLGEILGAIVVILAVALVAILLVWAIGKLVAYIRAKRSEVQPSGALLPPVRRPTERSVRGVVLASPTSGRSLASGELCVGWAAELSATRWFTRHVMLRDGASFGFDVRLDDGKIARIPAGALRLHRGGREESIEDVTRYLGSIDPEYRLDGDEPAIPHEEAATIEIRVGDRVEIFGEVHPTPDPEAAPTYRGMAAMILAPNDVPLIRRVS